MRRSNIIKTMMTDSIICENYAAIHWQIEKKGKENVLCAVFSSSSLCFTLNEISTIFTSRVIVISIWVFFVWFTRQINYCFCYISPAIGFSFAFFFSSFANTGMIIGKVYFQMKKKKIMKTMIERKTKHLKSNSFLIQMKAYYWYGPIIICNIVSVYLIWEMKIFILKMMLLQTFSSIWLKRMRNAKV